MDNPWDTPAGRRAQQVRTARLAAGSGEVADFAREVVAGRATSRDLLYKSVLSDRALQPVRDLVERWHRLPPAERARVEAEAATAVEDRIAALNGLPDEEAVEPAGGAGVVERRWSRGVRRAGDEPDPDEGRTFLSDAW